MHMLAAIIIFWNTMEFGEVVAADYTSILELIDCISPDNARWIDVNS